MSDNQIMIDVKVTATLRKWAEGADPETDEPYEVIENERVISVSESEYAQITGAADGPN